MPWFWSVAFAAATRVWARLWAACRAMRSASCCEIWTSSWLFTWIACRAPLADWLEAPSVVLGDHLLLTDVEVDRAVVGGESLVDGRDAIRDALGVTDELFGAPDLAGDGSRPANTAGSPGVSPD